MINNIFEKKYELYLKENMIDIKYYLKIISISNNKIEILLNKKRIIIKGSNLLIICMDEYEIVINGKCFSIQFIDE